MKLNVLDLFSGIGGFSLGLESTGFFKTIAFVEKDKFCQKVLQKNFPNIPIENEVRNVKGKTFKADVITGGFPCQPFSVAGKRRGTDDDRYLWGETIRIVSEQKPRWFIGENVEGIINIQNGLVFRQIKDDLESQGFEVQSLIIPASGVGAWHQRKRVWILGYSKHNGLSTSKIKGGNIKINEGSSKRQNKTLQFTRTSGFRNNGDVSNSKRNEYQHSTIRKSGTNKIWGFYSKKEKQATHDVRSKTTRCDGVFGTQTWWQTQSSICRVPNGVSDELDKDRANRIKSLGNSIVPQIAREIGQAIFKAETNN
jgi:DNA (cytosine-5)-methyltransferase 1